MAKNYKEAQEILNMVSDEEKKILSEQQQQASNTRKQSLVNLTNQLQQDNEFSNSGSCHKQNMNRNKSPIKQQASNTNVYRRNLWIKCALIEKKLVSIVEYLSENANKYYESDALMANYLCAQILSSLLVGPSALEFSKSKTNYYYQYNDPTADELLTRHKLANPIACLCSSRSQLQQQQQQLNNHEQQVSKNPIKFSKSTESPSTSTEHIKLAATQNSLNILSSSDYSSCQQSLANCDGLFQEQSNSTGMNKCLLSSASNRKGNIRKPLALKTANIKRGTLVTDCHHYSCQETSEHNHTRGYSFLCSSPNGLTAYGNSGQCNYNNQSSGNSAQVCQVIQDWSIWSPRMLHETLHQNSKSSLLYAKNNVLLEAQPNETMAGYLSLHETNTDLILKWIPNQMINGSQLSSSSNHNQSVQSNGNQENTKIDEEIVQETAPTSGNKRAEHSMAVESFYLDFVVSLSMSRIVLLHCQFAKDKQTSINQSDCHVNEKNLSQTTKIEDQSSDSNSEQNYHEYTQETLILIEADGVQKSPFIFPKGGLRAFLSCLENGLRPNKYLDPAIKFDDDGAFDPLEPEIGDMRASTPESPSLSPSINQSYGKLDSLLKRLPSLKRVSNKQACCDQNQNQNSEQTTDSNINTEEDQDQEQDQNVSRTEQPANDCSPIRKNLQTNHYVYRIVSTQQPDWPLQTPPHSALSVGSSERRGSFVVNGIKQANNQNFSQKFRWSLSRLARFSSKHSQQNGSKSSSTSAGGCGGGGGGGGGGSCGGAPINYNSQSINSTGIDSNSTVNGSLGSLLSFCQSSINNLNAENASIQSENLQSNDQVGQLEMPATNKTTQPQPKESEDIVDDSESSDLIRIEAKLNHLKQSTSDDVLQALRTQSIETLCKSMRKQIVARAFYGWLVHCRKAKIIKTHLIHLIKDEIDCSLIDNDGADQIKLANETIGETVCIYERGLTKETWQQLMKQKELMSEIELCKTVNKFVYYGGIADDNLRREVWPYLLEHYKFKDNEEQRKVRDELVSEAYKSCGRDWIEIEKIVKQRDSELLAANMAKVSNDRKMTREQTNNDKNFAKLVQGNPTKIGNGINGESLKDKIESCEEVKATATTSGRFKEKRLDSLQELPDTGSTQCDSEDIEQLSDREQVVVGDDEETNQQQLKKQSSKLETKKQSSAESKSNRKRRRRRYRLESTGSVGSDASITDKFGNNIHRIDKDVQRCDRNFWYFKDTKNLDKLRNIMCSYVWQHLDVGYVQGMCDLAAPFLVIFDDEIIAFICFNQLMKRMVANFPHGCAMDQHFESLKYLMQVLDPKLFEILQSNGDYTHFYFCYRWLLLDFKRGKLKR